MRSLEHDDTLADQLGFATDKLREGELDEAHRQLVRLIRKHRCDPEVIFLLALARRRLGYDISADALFGQALDRGYSFPPERAPVPHPTREGLLAWTDCSGTVHLVLKQRPRRANLTFMECEEAPSGASPADEAKEPEAQAEAPSTATDESDVEG